MKQTPLHYNRFSLWIDYVNLIFLHLVKMFPLVTRNLNEERIRIVIGNDAWGAGLQPLDIMQEKNHQIFPKKLGEN
jgi:hypothetical protein